MTGTASVAASAARPEQVEERLEQPRVGPLVGRGRDDKDVGLGDRVERVGDVGVARLEHARAERREVDDAVSPAANDARDGIRDAVRARRRPQVADDATTRRASRWRRRAATGRAPAGTRRAAAQRARARAAPGRRPRRTGTPPPDADSPESTNSSIPSAWYSSIRSATSSWLPTSAVPAPPRTSPTPAQRPGETSSSVGAPAVQGEHALLALRARRAQLRLRALDRPPGRDRRAAAGSPPTPRRTCRAR